jgi:hypothetical protein
MRDTMTSMIPPYYKQENRYTCSLAVLRMVLAYHEITVSEAELISRVEPEYGKDFRNLWNPTIAKLSCEYGIETTLYAQWPLFKKKNYPQALAEYKKHPQAMNYQKYERATNSDTSTEPLPLAYKEMFRAIELGCRCVYGRLTEIRLRQLLDKGCLIQVSVKLHLLYSGKKQAFHSILLFNIAGDVVSYHDPTYGENLHCPIDHLLRASTDVGAAIVYSGLTK